MSISSRGAWMSWVLAPALLVTACENKSESPGPAASVSVVPTATAAATLPPLEVPPPTQPAADLVKYVARQRANAVAFVANGQQTPSDRAYVLNALLNRAPHLHIAKHLDEHLTAGQKSEAGANVLAALVPILRNELRAGPQPAAEFFMAAEIAHAMLGKGMVADGKPELIADLVDAYLRRPYTKHAGTIVGKWGSDANKKALLAKLEPMVDNLFKEEWMAKGLSELTQRAQKSGRAAGLDASQMTEALEKAFVGYQHQQLYNTLRSILTLDAKRGQTMVMSRLFGKPSDAEIKIVIQVLRGHFAAVAESTRETIVSFGLEGDDTLLLGVADLLVEIEDTKTLTAWLEHNEARVRLVGAAALIAASKDMAAAVTQVLGDEEVSVGASKLYGVAMATAPERARAAVEKLGTSGKRGEMLVALAFFMARGGEADKAAIESLKTKPPALIDGEVYPCKMAEFRTAPKTASSVGSTVEEIVDRCVLPSLNLPVLENQRGFQTRLIDMPAYCLSSGPFHALLRAEVKTLR